MNDKDVKMISRSFDEYLNFVYNWNFINSLAFSSNIKKAVTADIFSDCFEPSNILSFLPLYLLKCKALNIFDDDIKNNLYLLINHIAELDKKTDKYKKNEILNNMKIILNNMGTDNYDFIRNQIILRDFGNLNYKKNLKKINNISNDIIDDSKSTYYDSIENDYAMLKFLMLNKKDFCDKYYKDVFLTKNFYRSINSFISDYCLLFCSETDFLSKVNFSLDKLEEFTKYSNTTAILNSNIDYEFYNIVDTTGKLVKKIAKKF